MKKLFLASLVLFSAVGVARGAEDEFEFYARGNQTIYFGSTNRAIGICNVGDNYGEITIKTSEGETTERYINAGSCMIVEGIEITANASRTRLTFRLLDGAADSNEGASADKEQLTS